VLCRGLWRQANLVEDFEDAVKISQLGLDCGVEDGFQRLVHNVVHLVQYESAALKAGMGCMARHHVANTPRQDGLFACNSEC
jgi:hypothetical protein